MDDSSASSTDPQYSLETLTNLILGMDERIKSQSVALEARLTSIEEQAVSSNARLLDLENAPNKMETPVNTKRAKQDGDLHMKSAKSLSPIFSQSTNSVSSSSSSTPPGGDHCLPEDFSKNFGFQTHSRQSLAPHEYRRAHMSVNMKADIPPFDAQLVKFKPYNVLRFIEQLDQYLLRYFKCSYSSGAETDYAVVVTQYVHDDFRRQLGMSLPPSVCDITDDKAWYSMANVKFFRFTRAALQPQSEYNYSQLLQYNVYLDNTLNLTNLSVFNFKQPFASILKFLHKFVTMHDFLNTPEDYVEGCFTCVPDVNCSTHGAIRVFKILLLQRCESVVVDALISMAKTALRYSTDSDAKKRRLSHIPGEDRRRVPPNKFESVEEFVKFVGFVIEDYLKLFKSQQRFIPLMKRRTFHSSPSSSVQLLDNGDSTQSCDDDDSSEQDYVDPTPDLELRYVATKSSDSLRKVNVCWQFLRNGECSQSKLGRVCPYSHTHTAVVEFANTELSKIVAVVNKCIPATEDRFALHRFKNTCNAKVTAGQQQDGFQPSHRKFSPNMLPQQKGARESAGLSNMSSRYYNRPGDRPGIIRMHPRPPVTPPTPVMPPVTEEEVEVIVLSDSDHLDDEMERDSTSTAGSDL